MIKFQKTNDSLKAKEFKVCNAIVTPDNLQNRLQDKYKYATDQNKIKNTNLLKTNIE